MNEVNEASPATSGSDLERLVIFQEMAMSKKAEFIGYIVTSCDVSETFDIHLAQLPEQDVDDSYHQQAAPFYIRAFDGGKKVRITVEEI